MIHVHAGTDWYGAVRHVGAFRVVTAFFHVSSFPVYPLYSAVIGPVSGKGQEWQSLPLARIDWQSVTVAYLRGLAGGLIILGSILLILGFMFWMLNDGQTDIPPTVIMSVGGLGIAAGVISGAPTYLLWRTPPSRERSIRQIADSQLSAAADPALLDHRHVREWTEKLDSLLNDHGIYSYPDAIQFAHELPAGVQQLLLLRVRCDLAVADYDLVHEGRTDLLLRGIVQEQ